MSALTWSEALALRQPQMDATHQEFVALLGAVEAALEGPADRLQASFDDFVAHTDAHFAQEDRWMAALGFAPGNCHAYQHQHVLKVLRDVQAAAPGAAVLRVLVTELAQWFPQHAQAMDAALAQVMADCGYDPAAGPPARTLADAVTTCGTGSCGT